MTTNLLSSKLKVRFAYLSDFFEFVEANNRTEDDDTFQLIFKCKKCLIPNSLIEIVSKDNNYLEVENLLKNHITKCNMSDLSDFLELMSINKSGKRKFEENNRSSEANQENNKKARLENVDRESLDSQRTRDKAFKQIMQYMINLPK